MDLDDLYDQIWSSESAPPADLDALFDEAFVPPGQIERYGRSLHAGVRDLFTGVDAVTLAAASPFLSDEKRRQWQQKRAFEKEQTQKIAPPMQPFLDDVRDRPVNAVVERVLRGAPQTAAVVGATLVHPAAGLAVGGALEGAPIATDLEAAGVDRGRAYTAGLGVGVVSGLLERVGAKSMLGQSKLVTQLIQRTGADRLLKKGPGVAGRAWSDLTEAMVGEGITETAQEANEMLWRYVVGGESQFDPDADHGGLYQISERLLEAGVVGSASGGTFAGPRILATDATRMARRSQQAAKDLSRDLQQGPEPPPPPTNALGLDDTPAAYQPLLNQFRGELTEATDPAAAMEVVDRWNETFEILGEGDGNSIAQRLSDLTEALDLPVKAPEVGTPNAGAQPSDVTPIDRYLIEASIEDGPKFLDRLQDAGSRLYREMISQQAPLDRIAKATGDTRLAQLVSTSRGVREMSRGPIVRGTRLFDRESGEYRRTGNSLKATLANTTPETLRDLRRLMVAERQVELSERSQRSEASFQAELQGYQTAVKQARIFRDRRRKFPGQAPQDLVRQHEAAVKAIPPKPKRKDFGILKVDNDATTDAHATLAMLRGRWQDRTPELNHLAESVRDWSHRAILDPLLEVGALSTDRYEAILGDNQKYVPFFRLIEEIEGRPELQYAKGKDGKPLRKISSDAAKGVADPLENLVLKAQDVHMWVERQRVRNQLADLADGNDLSEVVPLKGNRGRPKSGDLENYGTFGAWRDGQRSEYIGSREIIDTLEGLSPKQAGLVMRAAMIPAKVLRAGATLGVGFIVRNPIRDQFTASVYSKHGYVPFWDLAKGLFYMSPHGRKLATHHDDFFDSGAGMATLVSADRQHARLQVDQLTPKTGVSAKAKAALKAWKADGGYLAVAEKLTLGPLQKLSETMELGTRLGGFAKARSKGASMLEASQEARDLTLDFGRFGTTGQKWNYFEAFVNAELQDVDRFARAMKAAPLKTSVKALSYITIPALINLAINRDDEDWQNLPDWDRQLFLHLHKFEDGSFLRVPRPIGSLNLIFGYGMEQAAAHMAGSEPAAMEKLADSLVEQTPLHFLMHRNPDTGRLGADPADMVPTGLEPWVEARSNRDEFRGGPVVPAAEAKLPTFLQGDELTSPVMRWLSDKTGASPHTLQHLWSRHTATVGRYAQDAVDSAAFGHERPVPPDPPGKAAGRFLGLTSRPPYGFSTKPVHDFYERYHRALKGEAGLREASDLGHAAAVLRVRKEYPESQHTPLLRQTAKELTKWRKLRKEILTDPSMEKHQRAEMILQIDMLVTQLTAATNQQIETLP